MCFTNAKWLRGNTKICNSSLMVTILLFHYVKEESAFGTGIGLILKELFEVHCFTMNRKIVVFI